MAETALQMPTRRDRQRAETHERLFVAACAEIERVGLAEAQIPRIASEAGVARATFYFHFPTKEDVLEELAQRLQTGLTDALAEADPDAQPLREVIAGLVERMLIHRAYVGESNLMRELLAHHVRRAQREEPHAMPGLPEALGPHFAAAARRGEIRTPIEPERLSALLLASMFGLLLGGQSAADDDLREGLAVLTDVFVRGLST